MAKVLNNNILLLGTKTVLKLPEQKYQIYIIQKWQFKHLIKQIPKSSKVILYSKCKNPSVTPFMERNKKNILMLIGNFKKNGFYVVKTRNLLNIENILNTHLQKCAPNYYQQQIQRQAHAPKPAPPAPKPAQPAPKQLAPPAPKPTNNLAPNTFQYKKILFLGPGPKSSISNVNYYEYDVIIFTNQMCQLLDNLLAKYKHLKIAPFFSRYYSTNYMNNINKFINKYNNRIIYVLTQNSCRKLFTHIEIPLITYRRKLFYAVNKKYKARKRFYIPLGLIKILFMIRNTDYKQIKITGITFYSTKCENYMDNYKVDFSPNIHNLQMDAQYLSNLIKSGKPIIVDPMINNRLKELQVNKV